MSEGKRRRSSRELTRRKFVGLSATALATGLSPRLLRAAGESRKASVDTDVVVIGAGLAGLTAARELIRLGKDSLIVLEARDRVGGRTLNLPIGGGHIVEGGGEWIGPGQDRIAQLANQLKVQTFPAFYEGDTTFDVLNKVSTGLIPEASVGQSVDFLRLAWKIDRAAMKLPAGKPWNLPDAAQFDRRTLGDWLSEHGRLSRAYFAALVSALRASSGRASATDHE